MNVSELELEEFYFASESVTEGHPDKMCDQISDSILDACLEQDSDSLVCCDTAAKGNFVFVCGEIKTNAIIDIDKIVRQKIKDIGYDEVNKGIDYKTCDVVIKINQASNNLNKSNLENDINSRDDKPYLSNSLKSFGTVFGYASSETKDFFPLSHILALKLSERLAEVRKNGICKWMRPDGKTQITIQYKKVDNEIIPIRIHNCLISTQHDSFVQLEILREEVKKHVIDYILPEHLVDDKTTFFINPSQKFIIGGPEADAGLTGRKIIVDTYGGWGSHGGGAFSGRDCSHIIRSGSYGARWIAKSIVENNLANRCLVQLNYSVGLSNPLSIYVNTYGTSKKGYNNNDILDIITNNFELSPLNLIKELKLKNPIYSKTAVYGHFGRNDPDFTWEHSKQLI